MKICLAQLNYHIGDFDFNLARIREAIQQAKGLNADLVIFAELAICGYPARDFLEFRDFIDRCEDAVKEVALESAGIAVVVGSPSRNHTGKGKPLYNSAFFLADGEVRSVAHKTLLPNYDVFDEYRYFEPNRLPYSLVEYKGVKLAITICEDLWNIGDDPLYVRNPMDELAKLQPDVIINIAASPFNYNQPVIRKEVLCSNALKYELPVVYVNHVGGQTELLFDGGSMVIDASGNVARELPLFSEEVKVFRLEEITGNYSRKSQPGPVNPWQSIALIHAALVMGIRDYFGKMGFSKAILGLSGGIDSALTLVLATEALGRENVRAILLPSRFSSDHSIADARQLAENLKVPFDVIPIGDSVDAVEKTLNPHFKDLPFNLAEENIQARMRAVILMALSNKFGYILLNTSNKSEAAVGYGTLYGDMCGGLSVLGDVYKTQVYELSHYINRKDTIIPANSILKPPSAELRPGQKDSDSLPDYGTLDKILVGYIEQRLIPAELVHLGFEEETVKRVLNLVNTSEYKRHQAPPILRISPKAFGMGRRMPIVARYRT